MRPEIEKLLNTDDDEYDFIYGFIEEFWKEVMDIVSKKSAEDNGTHFAVYCNLAAISRLIEVTFPHIDLGDQENPLSVIKPPVHSPRVTFTTLNPNLLKGFPKIKQEKQFKPNECKDKTTPKKQKPKMFRSTLPAYITNPVEAICTKKPVCDKLPIITKRPNIRENYKVAKYESKELGDLRLLTNKKVMPSSNIENCIMGELKMSNNRQRNVSNENYKKQFSVPRIARFRKSLSKLPNRIIETRNDFRTVSDVHTQIEVKQIRDSTKCIQKDKENSEKSHQNPAFGGPTARPLVQEVSKNPKR